MTQEADRRWYQFELRLLFVWVTVAAVLLGIVLAVNREIEREVSQYYAELHADYERRQAAGIVGTLSTTPPPPQATP